MSQPVKPVPEAVVLAALRAGIKDLSWLRFDSSALDIQPTELVIDSAGLSEVSDEFTDESADVDDSGEARKPRRERSSEGSARARTKAIASRR